MKKSNAVLIMKLSDGSEIPQINEVLSELTGVTNYRLNPVNRTVRVEFDPEKITEERIRNSLLKE